VLRTGTIRAIFSFALAKPVMPPITEVDRENVSVRFQIDAINHCPVLQLPQGMQGDPIRPGNRKFLSQRQIQGRFGLS
jgi:hypothetical protein